MMEKKSEKIQHQNVTDQVYYALKLKIEKNEWLPGDRLPSENDLAQTYGVSRMSVRMALQKLVAFGMLEVKNGGGYSVKDFEFSHVVEHISGMMLHNIDYDDFNSFRSLIEIQSLEVLNGKNLKPQDLKKLTECCREMKRAADRRDAEAFANADYDFHRQICAMSGNGMFVYSYELIGPLFMEYLEQHYEREPFHTAEKAKVDSIDAYYSDAVKYHEQIVEDIRQGNIQKAQDIIRQFTHVTAI